MSDLEIKISGDNSDLKAKIEEIKEQTAGLEDKLTTVAAVSGVAFAALNAVVGHTVEAFGESQKATLELNLALQNQGIFTQQLVEDYSDFAKAVQDKTGIDDDALVTAQATLQSFLGQNKVTLELTQSIADLSIKTGSTTSAAEILGRAVQGNVRGLKQFGIQIDENLSQNERLAAITEKVQQKFGGLAEESNKGLGGIKGLKDAFQSFEEELGKRFAPTIEKTIQAKTEFFKGLANNEALLDVIANVVKVGLVLTGAALGFTTASLAVVKVSQAIKIASAAMEILGLSTRALVGATGIGLLLIVATEIYLNWGKIFPAMQAVFEVFSSNISQIASGLGTLLSGVFTFNIGKVKAGLDAIKSVVTQSYEAIKSIAADSGEEEIGTTKEQDKTKQDLADEAAAKLKESEELKREIRESSAELIQLQLDQASEKTIALKKSEIDILTNLEKENNEAKIQILNNALEANSKALEASAAHDKKVNEIFRNDILKKDSEFQKLSTAQKDAFLKENQAKLVASIITEEDALSAQRQKDIADNIKFKNQYIIDQAKYGAAVAAVNEVIHSKEVAGTEQAAGALVGLANSKNSTLKGIGKAAAVSQIAIDTAKGAVAAFTGFLDAIPFPPVSIPLGIAAAAGVIAYGAERTANVVSAAAGGIIPGFNKGGDSVHSFLQPGELVVPTSNFSEVVNAVAAQRSAAAPEATSGTRSSPSISLEIGFSGDQAEKFLTARQVEARSLGTLRQASS